MIIPKTRILSVKEKPENLERVLSEFKLNQHSPNEWMKNGITVVGGMNTMSGESRFTIRIKTLGIMENEEKESLEIYERLKKEYANKVLSTYSI